VVYKTKMNHNDIVQVGLLIKKEGEKK